MIRRDISKSLKFSSLSKDSQVLFCLLIPHFNSYGKMNGEPSFVKGECVPLLHYLTIPKIKRCLREITLKTSVKWFKKDDLFYLQATSWKDHQDIRGDRLGHDELPVYPGVVQDNSSTSPGQLPPEVKAQAQVEVEVEEEVEYGNHKKFTKPTPQQVGEYAKTLGFTLNGNMFFDYYESKGWLVGKSGMRDWKAAVRTWHGKHRERHPEEKPKRDMAEILKQREAESGSN